MPDFTIQDLAGSLWGVALYTGIFLFPGYVAGWGLDIFSFRKRLLATQFLMGVMLSSAISPVIFFLYARLLSVKFAIWVALMIVFIGVVIMVLTTNKVALSEDRASVKKYTKAAVIAGTFWILFTILRLVDIQIGHRLYYSVASYDLTTRVSVIDAISRTGVPPANPSYFPGHTVPLTFLYYFWYVMGGMIDTLGGSWVSPYQTMLASIAWSSVVTMATTAVYLRLRGNKPSYQSAIIATQLYWISGLDFIPVISQMLYLLLTFGGIYSTGQIEGWNIPIMSWMNAIAWVPHHLVAAFACLTAMTVMIETIKGQLAQWKAVLVAGLALASAFGLSVWVPFVFAAFWGIWSIALYRTTRKMTETIRPMLASGIIAVLAILPFLIDLFTGRSPSDSTGFPIALYVRPFAASQLFDFTTTASRNFFNLLALPVNYFFEFGFFFLTALLWLRVYHKSAQTKNPYHTAELLLLIVVFVFMSFVRSTIITINDLGIRPWLLAQFILLVWATDIVSGWQRDQIRIQPTLFKPASQNWKFHGVFRVVFMIGLLTSILEVSIVRFWPMAIDSGLTGFPNDLSPDKNLGERTYYARLTYEYLQGHISPQTIVQYNPISVLDRPSGLYGNHQTAISDRTAYGVPQNEFNTAIQGVGKIFQIQERANWSTIDSVCNEYSIDYLIVEKSDPLWAAINHSLDLRVPIIKNAYYQVFYCGK